MTGSFCRLKKILFKLKLLKNPIESRFHMGPWKIWKWDFTIFIFQAWKIMDFTCTHVSVGHGKSLKMVLISCTK